MKNLNLLLAIGIVFGSISCKKKHDVPPVQTIPVGSILTLAELKAVSDTATGNSYTFTEDYSVYATVTNDENSGNFYKEIYVQVGSDAMQLRMANAGGIYEGDSVRIYLKGTTVGIYNGMYQLDGVDVDNNIIKQAVGKSLTPTLRSLDPASPIFLNPTLDRGLLIKLDNVEFEGSSVGSTWSNSVAQTDVNHNLVDCNGNSVVVRTSGYANFADQIIPELNGSFIGIVGVYSSSALTLADVQLFVREPKEANFTVTRCTSIPYLAKNFNDGSTTSGGWTVFDVLNPNAVATWTISSQGSTSNYGMIKNFYNSQNNLIDSWLISPAIDLTATTGPILRFDNAYSYTGAQIETYVSTNYSGTGDPNNATWNLLGPVTFSSGSFLWANSGAINLASYKTSNVHIAIRYTGASSGGSTWEIDNIKIEEL